MKVSHYSKEARKLFELYDKINKFERGHVVEKFRREIGSGIAIIYGISLMAVVTMGLLLAGGA